MASIDDLNDVAEAFLAASIDALNLTEAGAPARAYVSPGQAALDCCDQVVIWTQTLDDAALAGGQGALAAAKAMNRGMQPQVTLNVQATRCTIDTRPQGSDDWPFPSDLQETARMVDQDGWALRCHLMWELRHGALAQICSGAEFLGGQKLIPQGNCVGWLLTFRYPIEGGVLGA